MTKEQFYEWAERNGWTVNSYGHCHKTTEIAEYRFKVQKHTIRYERKVVHEATQYSPRRISWVRIRSGRFSQLEIVEGDKLRGFKR